MRTSRPPSPRSRTSRRRRRSARRPASSTPTTTAPASTASSPSWRVACRFATTRPAASARSAISPPFLSGAFNNVQQRRASLRSGFIFQMYLPARLADAARRRRPVAARLRHRIVAAAKAEVMWMCYAWPSSYGNSGKRTLLRQPAAVTSSGQPQQRRSSYNGTTKMPAVDRRVPDRRDQWLQHGQPRWPPTRSGVDGERWIVVN